MSDIDVSVVICTYNRADMLRAALESLVAQRTESSFRYEVVVVDNASTDGTPEVIQSVRERAAVPLRGVHEPRQGVPFARNRAIAEASGPWLAFFDDDQVADPDWLKELLAMAHQTGARCVGGAVRLLLPETQCRALAPVIRRALGELVGEDAPCRYCGNNSAGTGNLLLHRSVIEQIGMFDETLQQGGSDNDLYQRIRRAKIDAWYTPRAVARHVVPAYRLQEEYLRWAFRRHGWHFARRDRNRRGAALLWPLLAARLGQAAFLRVPQLLAAQLLGARSAAAGVKCRLWAAEGYLRGTLYLTAPRLCSQPRFQEQLAFRAERHMFGGQVTSARRGPDSKGE
jgi:glycosyltransferase involved in cell wall biosynthesis